MTIFQFVLPLKKSNSVTQDQRKVNVQEKKLFEWGQDILLSLSTQYLDSVKIYQYQPITHTFGLKVLHRVILIQSLFLNSYKSKLNF